MLDFLRKRFLGTHHEAHLARGSLGVILIRLCGLAVLFGLQKELISYMGGRSYGIYAYVLAWVQSLCLISLLGMDQVLVRFLASYRTKNRWNLFHGLYRWGKRLMFLSSFIAAVCTAGVAWLLRNQMEKEIFRAFLIGSALLWMKGLQEFYRAALQGLKHPVQAMLPRYLLVPLFLWICVMVAFRFSWSEKKFTAWEILGFETVVTLVILVLSQFWLMRSGRDWPADNEPMVRSSNWIQTALPLLVSSGILLINAQMGKILLGLFRPPEEVGIFNIAFEVALLVTFGLTSVNIISAPLIAELHAKWNHVALQRILEWSMLVVLILSTFIGLVLVFFGRFLLGFFGPNFTQGYSVMLILLAGYGLRLLGGPVGIILSMTGRQNRFALFVLAEGVMSCILGCVLIPFLGMIGAGLAMTLSGVCLHWIAAVSILYSMKLDPTVFSLLGLRRESN